MSTSNFHIEIYIIVEFVFVVNGALNLLTKENDTAMMFNRVWTNVGSRLQQYRCGVTIMWASLSLRKARMQASVN